MPIFDTSAPLSPPPSTSELFLTSDPVLSTLCSRRVNVGCGPAEERVLLTGLHAVADIYCENCKTTLGWKYVRAIHQTHFLLLCLEALFCNRPCVLVTHDRIPDGQIMCCGRSKHRGCSY